MERPFHGQAQRHGRGRGAPLDDSHCQLLPLGHLQRKRDRVVGALSEIGYEVQSPQATFYVLPKSPIEDDVLFARTLAAQKVLVLPGTAVDMPGYFRISLTATDAMIDRALPVFAEVMSRLTASVPR